MIELWNTPFVKASALRLTDLRYFFDDRIEITVAEASPGTAAERTALINEEAVDELRSLKERSVLMQVGLDSQRWVVEIPWQHVALQIVDESLYRLSERPAEFGCSYIWSGSPWQEEFVARHPLTQTLRPKTRHYVIATSFDIVDLLSDVEPRIRSL